MKKCSCGKIYARVPEGARLALDSIAAGYYYNCECTSTLFFPYRKYSRPGQYSKRDMTVIVLMLCALVLISIYFLN